MIERLLVNMAVKILRFYGYQYLAGKFDGPVDIYVENTNEEILTNKKDMPFYVVESGSMIYSSQNETMKSHRG